jgi:transmembrane protein EpsG
MLIYYLVFIVSYFFCIFDFIKNRIVQNTSFVIFSVLLALLAGLRKVGVDNDSGNYQYYFSTCENMSYYQIIKGDYWDNIERGYYLLNKLVYSFGGSFSTLLLVVSLLTSALNYSIILKYCRYPFLSLLFYLSFFYIYRDFTQIRYGLACGFVFYSVHYLINKNFLLFFVYLTLSILFHNTSYILFLILPFCLYIKNKYIYFFFPIIGFVGFFYNFLPMLLSKGIAIEHMEIYLEETGTAGFMIPVIGFFIMIVYILNEKLLLQNGKFKSSYVFFFRLFSISITLNFLFFQVSIFQRFSYLFFQFGILLLPMMLFDLQKSKFRIYWNLGYAGFATVFLFYGIRMISPFLLRPYFD